MQNKLKSNKCQKNLLIGVKNCGQLYLLSKSRVSWDIARIVKTRWWFSKDSLVSQQSKFNLKFQIMLCCLLHSFSGSLYLFVIPLLYIRLLWGEICYLLISMQHNLSAICYCDNKFLFLCLSFCLLSCYSSKYKLKVIAPNKCHIIKCFTVVAGILVAAAFGPITIAGAVVSSPRVKVTLPGPAH